jgi:hypothetical protein
MSLTQKEKLVKNFIAVLKNTDKRFWIGIPLMGVGYGLTLVGAHRDGINDAVRAIEQEIKNTEEKN